MTFTGENLTFYNNKDHFNSWVEKIYVFTPVYSDALEKPIDTETGWVIKKATENDLKNKSFIANFKNYLKLRNDKIWIFEQNELKQIVHSNDIHNPTKASKTGPYCIAVIEAKEQVSLGSSSISEALTISDADGIAGYKYGLGSTSRYHYYLGHMVNNNPVASWVDNYHVISKDGLEDFCKVAKLRSQTLSPEVLKHLKAFLWTDHIPEYSVFKFLAYFSVLEALLTSKPEKNDTFNSITKQFSRNIKLIHNYLLKKDINIGFDKFTCDVDKAISKLYSYRSAIAHGTDLESPSNQLKKVLRSDMTSVEINLWLRRLTRKVFRFCLMEQDIAADLS